VLRNYLKQFTDDEENWHMLTGYSQEEIEEFGLTQFQTIIQKPETSHQVIHGTNFYLVDAQGYLINEYNYIDDSYIEEVIKDINNMDNWLTTEQNCMGFSRKKVYTAQHSTCF